MTETMTAAEYRAMIGGPKRNKYNAKKTEVDGVVFDSKREAARYRELKLLQDSGEIFNLVLQPTYTLQEAFRDNQGKVHRAIKYKADFAYKENGVHIVEDVKGKETAVFKIKAKLFIKRYPGVVFRVTR